MDYQRFTTWNRGLLKGQGAESELGTNELFGLGQCFQLFSREVDEIEEALRNEYF